MSFTSEFFTFDGIKSTDMGINGWYIIRQDAEINTPFKGSYNIKEDRVPYQNKPTFYTTELESMSFSLTFSILEQEITDKVLREFGSIFCKNKYCRFSSSDNVGIYYNVIATSEIKAILESLPTKLDIDSLENSLEDVVRSSVGSLSQQQQRNLSSISNKLELLKELPNTQELYSLFKAVEEGVEQIIDSNGMTSDGLINHLNTLLEKLPDSQLLREHQNELRALLEDQRTTGRISQGELLQSIDKLQDDLSVVNNTNIKAIQDDVSRVLGLSRSVGRKMNTSEVERINTLKLKELREEYRKNNSVRYVPKAQDDALKEEARQYAIQFMEQYTTPEENYFMGRRGSSSSSSSQSKPKPNLEIDETQDEEGFGMIRARQFKSKIHPKYSAIVGKGVALTETPKKFYEFGKYMVSMTHLSNNILKVKYLKTGLEVPQMRAIRISDELTDLIEDFCETQRLNEKALAKLPSEDKRLFSKLINQSGLYGKYKVRVIKNDEEQEEEKRFDLVKGQYIAGNDNPEILKELKRLLIKFIMEGKIPKGQGNELLFQISMNI
jgi:hypothetical protein